MSGKKVLGCFCCLVLVAVGCDSRKELTRVDSEKEANRILVELEGRGVSKAEKEAKAEQRKTAFSITVPQDQLSLARTILVQCDLPRETHSGYAAMAESSSLIPTRSEERAKLMHAMAGELERTLETYDRVVSARVHIVLPEKDALQRDTNPKPGASAMVLIKYTPPPEKDSPGAGASIADAHAGPATTGSREHADAPVGAEEVQQMVARSVEGLTKENVFVTYTRSSGRPPAAAPAPAAAGDAGTARPLDHTLLMEVFAAAALFGVVAIVLTALLVREKRKQRTALALTHT